MYTCTDPAEDEGESVVATHPRENWMMPVTGLPRPGSTCGLPRPPVLLLLLLVYQDRDFVSHGKRPT